MGESIKKVKQNVASILELKRGHISRHSPLNIYLNTCTRLLDGMATFIQSHGQEQHRLSLLKGTCRGDDGGMGGDGV